MGRAFYVPPRLSPSRSLLGLGIRCLVQDRWQAESVYLVVFPLIVLLVILAQFIAWTWLEPAAVAATRFFWAQVLAILAVALLGAVGFKPPVRIFVHDSGLVLRQGKRLRTLSHDAIRSFAVITALAYHREYRRQRAVVPFISRLTPEVVIIVAAQTKLAVGLMPSDQAVFTQCLERATAGGQAIACRAVVNA